MNGEVIKSFLVGLGFGVDESSLSKFNKSIASAAVRVTALYGTIQTAAAGIFFGISKISEGFEQMGYEYRIIAPAINKALILRREMLRAYAAAGINITKVVQQSVKFNMSLAKTQFALKAIYTSVGAKFFPLLTKQMDVFRGMIYQNMPKIQAALEKFINFIFKMFDATIILGNRVWSILSRVYDFFVQLDKATGGWSTVIMGVIAAWKLLNLSFLATPLGMLIAGLTTILALWDDFQTYKDGGESLLDWGKRSTQIMVGLAGAMAAIPAALFLVSTAVTKTKDAIDTYNKTVQNTKDVLENAKKAWGWFATIMAANPVTAWIIGITALIVLIGLLIWKWKEVKAIIEDVFGYIGAKIEAFDKWLSKFIGKGGEGFWGGKFTNAEGGLGQMNQAPLGTQGLNNSQTNQNVNQQTQINVMGSADANSVGKAVAGEQSRVNFDMVRNLTGATR